MSGISGKSICTVSGALRDKLWPISEKRLYVLVMHAAVFTLNTGIAVDAFWICVCLEQLNRRLDT